LQRSVAHHGKPPAVVNKQVQLLKSNLSWLRKNRAICGWAGQIELPTPSSHAPIPAALPIKLAFNVGLNEVLLLMFLAGVAERPLTLAGLASKSLSQDLQHHGHRTRFSPLAPLPRRS
jgi:hypothetical protein